MACSIDYLRKTYSGENLRVLANHHYQIKDELANSKLFRKDPQGKLHYFKDKLVNEAITKIGSINARYANYIPSGTKIAHMDSDGLKINISPVADYILAENDAVTKYEEEKFMQEQNQLEEIFYYEGTKEAGSTAEPEDSKETTEKTKQYFNTVLQDLRIKIKAVRETLREKPYAKGYKERLKELEDVIAHEDELHAIMEYISMSSGQLRAAKKEFDYIKEKYGDGTDLSANDISDFDERLNEIKEFMHFYSNLEQINVILKENNLLLQSEEKQYIKEQFDPFLTPEIEAAVDKLDLTSVSSVNDFFKTLAKIAPEEKADFINTLKDWIDSIDRDGKSIDKKLEKAIETQGLIIKDFNDYFVNLTAEWLFPYIDKTNKTLEAKGYEDDVITKDQLKILLRKANKDVSFFSKNLGATISSSDPVTAAVALALKDLIYKAQTDTNDIIYELTDLYEKKGVKRGDAAKFHEQYIRQAQVKTNDFHANGDPVYRPMPAFHEDMYYDLYQKDFNKFIDDLETELKADENRMRAENERLMASGVISIPRYSEEMIEAIIKKKRARKKRIWYEENTDLVDNPTAILDAKRASMTPKRFENWLRSNILKQDNTAYYDEDAGTLVFRKDTEDEKGRTVPEEYLKGIKLKDNEFAIYSGDFITPKRAKYINKDFQKFKDDPYFQRLYGTYKKMNDKYPKTRRLSFGIIPQIGKDRSMKERYLDKDGKPSKEKLKEQINNAWEASDDEQEIMVPTENGEEEMRKVSRIRQKVDGSTVRNVPIRYTVLYDDPSAVSTNLLETVTMFASTANSYESMSKIEPNIDILKSVINGDPTLKLPERKILANNSRGNAVVSFFVDTVPQHLLKEKGIRINEMLNEFINDVVYGEEEEKEVLNVLGYDLSLNKVANNLGFLTSMYSMAGNITAGINNALIGNINTFSEAIGGKYYNKSQWWAAKKQYWNEVGKGTFFSDLGENNWNKKSLYTQMQVHFDALQGEFLDPRGKVQTGSTLNKLMSRDTLFFNQHATEHEIQMTSFIAMLKGYKLEDGSAIFDAYEKGPNGRMQIKDEFKYLVTPEVEQDFRNRLHAINKQHHGNYNKFDKSGLQRKWYGKLALMFRKYLYTSFKSRLGGRQIDYEIGDAVEGYYSVSGKIAWKFIKKMQQDLKENASWANTKNLKEGLTDDEWYALRRTGAELSFLMVANMIILGLSAMDLDDDDDVANAIHLQAKRIQQDLLQFIPPFSFTPLVRLFTNPSAAFNVIEKILDLMTQLYSDPFGTYKRDTGFAEKGDYKTWIKFLKLLPLYRQYITLTTSSEQLKYYDLLKTTK